MLEVIKKGGKKYRVEEKEIIKVEKVDGEEGEIVELEEVMMVGQKIGEKKVEG